MFDESTIAGHIEDYAKKEQARLTSGNENLILSSYEKQMAKVKRSRQFEPIEEVVNVARDLFMTTNKPFGDMVTDLIEALESIKTTQAKDHPAVESPL